MKHLIVAVAAAVVASACISEEGAQRLTDELTQLKTDPVAETSPLYKSIAVRSVIGGRTGDPTPSALVTNEQFREYAETTLAGRDMLSEGEPVYVVDADIVSVGYPPFAMNRVNVTATVHYELVERATEATVFETDIVTSYESGMKDATMYAARQGIGAAAATAKNVAAFADALEAAFPAPDPTPDPVTDPIEGDS